MSLEMLCWSSNWRKSLSCNDLKVEIQHPLHTTFNSPSFMLNSDKHLQTHSSEQQPSLVHICGQYRVSKLLGCGTFGELFCLRHFNLLNPLGNIYLGWDIKTKQDVTLKLKPIQSQHPQLHHELGVYKALSNVAGIPTMHWYGQEDPYSVLILNCLGLTLEGAIPKCHNVSLVFVCANQMVFSILCVPCS